MPTHLVKYVNWLVLATGLAFGCAADAPTIDSTPTLACDASLPPAFLESQIDDEDGDGYVYDEDYPDIDDEDDDIADHAWVRDRSGALHLFFQNEDRGNGTVIEHYVTSDMTGLDYVGVALRPNPNGWDSHGLWAPHIVEIDGVYYMFYAGTDGRDATSTQRIGLATSTDLNAWTRCTSNACPGTSGDGCVYECDENWTAWGGGTDHDNQCRDPFVIWDDAGKRWVMFATTKSTNGFGTVTTSYSANLIEWIGAGFIDATRRLDVGIGGQTSGGHAENPFVISFEGTHYLLFTDWQDPEDSLDVDPPRTIVQYATSALLAADPAGSANWTYRGYTPDPGVNAIEALRIDKRWIMSQSISNERSGDLDRRRQLRLKCVTWQGGFRFDTTNLQVVPVKTSSGVLGPGR